MGKINSKQKGNKAEREVAKILSDWSGMKFIRTPMSGAIHNLGDKRVVSDIVAPLDIKWPFSIEVKNVESSWEFNTLIENTSILWKHWQQAIEDAQREGMIPALVFTKNYRGIFIALEQSVFENLFELILPKSKSYIECINIQSLEHGEIVIMNFETFLKIFELKVFEKFYDKYLVKNKP